MALNVNFNDLYQRMVDGETSVAEASRFMQSPEVHKLINSLVYKKSIDQMVPFYPEELQNIQGIINVAQFIYNDSGMDTGLTDSEYDALYEAMLRNGGDDIITVPILPNANNIAHHKYPSLRGTLTKTYYLSTDEKRTNPSRHYLDEWIQTMENKIYQATGKQMYLNDEEIYVFPKFDGVSGIFEMNTDGTIGRVLTRGFTERNEAQDITRHFQGLPIRKYHEINGAYGLKTEVMMYESDLAKFNETYHTDYKNTRSIVSGILNSEEYDPYKAQYLHVVPLRVGDLDGNQELAQEAFKLYPYLRCRLKDREAIRNFAYSHRYIHDELRCDGAVIYIINPEIQKILGRENDKNNFEVAYKFTEESAMTILEDVSFNMGSFGRLAPVAKVKPVKLKGNTIEKVSLGSVGRFRSLKLHEGDKVKILYDIIPYLAFDKDCSHNYDGKQFVLPATCPECGEILEFSDTGDVASCVNPNCACRRIGKIINYLNKMSIDGLSYGVISRLYHEGIVKNVVDLYKLEKHKKEIIGIDGFGPKLVNSWIDAIEEKSTVEDYIFLGSLGIEGVSKKTFSKIMNVMTLDELLDVCDNNLPHSLISIPSIQAKTAEKIITGVNANIKLIEKLEKYLNIKSTKGSEDRCKFAVCFTMIRNKNLEKWILEHDGRVDATLTKATTFLVVPSLDTTSDKVEKAKKYGAYVIPIDKAIETFTRYISSIE